MMSQALKLQETVSVFLFQVKDNSVEDVAETMDTDTIGFVFAVPVFSKFSDCVFALMVVDSHSSFSSCQNASWLSNVNENGQNET